MADRLDIIIMGATGFTGMHCIPQIHHIAKSASWGIAGRSEEKLQKVLEKMGKQVDADFSNIPVIVCNIEDDESLFQMAKRTKLVLNCVGPYVLYGERMVDACIKAGTHHIDVSGEPQYMENMQLLKHEYAKEKGIYIISACGLDSIPADLGVIYVNQNFEGVLNSVVSYLEFEGPPKSSGPLINYGTWETLVYNVSSVNKLKEIRRELFPQRLPSFKPKLNFPILPHTSDIVDGWVLPFPGADRSVMKRTQRYFYESENKRPIQVNTLFVLKSFIQIIFMTIWAVIFLLFTRFSFGRKLLLDYPDIFSFGFFSKKQPSRETIENSWFQITFYGEGWKEKLANKNDQYPQDCDKKIVARVRGKNPGYGSTCICLVAAAITVLKEKDKMAGNGKGGVYPPGAAFANTSLIEILNENGVTFDIISDSN